MKVICFAFNRCMVKRNLRSMNSKHFSKFTSGSFLCSVKITEYPLHSSSVLEINTDWNYRTLYQYINMHIFYKSVIKHVV